MERSLHSALLVAPPMLKQYSNLNATSQKRWGSRPPACRECFWLNLCCLVNRCLQKQQLHKVIYGLLQPEIRAELRSGTLLILWPLWCLTVLCVLPSFSKDAGILSLPSFLPLLRLLPVGHWQLSNGLSCGPSSNWKSVIAGRWWSRHLWVWVVGWVLRRWAGRSRVTWEPDSLPRGAVNTS